MRAWIRRRKYKRRASKLEFVIKTCGFDTAVRYGEKRGWIDRYDRDRIWLAP